MTDATLIACVVTGAMAGCIVLAAAVLGREMGRAKAEILSMLADGPATGLELVRRAPEGSAIDRGSVYVALSDLEDSGLVSSEPRPSPFGVRRVYRLTQ